MDKRYLHHLWRRIRPVKMWYLLAAGLIMAVVCVFALRHNNLQMVRLRNAVYQADERGGNVEAAIQQLRAYVYAHMNTSLASGTSGVYPPIQLKYTYQRLRDAEQSRVTAINAKIYPDAQAYCEQTNPDAFSGRTRVPCIEQYVATHGAKARVIPDSLYKFDFTAARWSPDLAGWSLVAAILLLFLALARLVAGWWLQNFIK